MEYSTDMATEGTGSLKLSLSLSGTAWEEGGVYVDPPTAYDWSAASTVSADVYVPAEATNFLAQIFVKTGEGWTWANSADAQLTPGEWTTVTADLSTLGEIADVHEVGVKVGSGSTAFTGDVFIDNIALGSAAEQAAVEAVEVTPELLYGFESDAEGWIMADYWAGGKGIEYSTDMATEGTGSLKLSLSLSGTAWEEGGVYVDPPTAYDWSTANTVSADVYVPAEATNFLAQIFVKTGEAWTWANSADVQLTPGEWTTVTADLSALGEIADVHEVGVKVGSGSTAFTGDVFIDNLMLNVPTE
ncbi:MAG: hypothetical protein HY866_16405 [Chloroflexi bacterium]|nr:hypothetical protein [Chloroflexota bacterium]